MCPVTKSKKDWLERRWSFLSISERDSLTVSALVCHAADLGSNPAPGDDFFNFVALRGLV